MITFAPNISWLFPELPFEERVQAVDSLGFKAIEFGFPSHANLILEAARKKLGMTIVLFNQDVPVWDANNRGYLVDPSRMVEFRKMLGQALDIARRLHVLKIMLPVGVELPGLERTSQLQCMLENLDYAAKLAECAQVPIDH